MRWCHLGRRALLALLTLAAAEACEEARPRESTVTYAELASTFERACAECHTGDAASAGYRVGSYWEVIGCGDSGPVLADGGGEAPLLRVLREDEAHRALLSEAERAQLAAWLSAGAPKFRGTVHRAGIIDPRSDDWHGTLLRERGWAPVRDPDDPLVCGRCHAGAPVTPAGVTSFAPTATPCSDCHTRPAGALDCATCHGQGERPSPPRDACYFDATPDAHAAHVAPSLRATPLACGDCHPEPGPGVFEGSHADGQVDVTLDPAVAGEAGAWQPASGRCADVACHARGGEDPSPAWRDTSDRDCSSCHKSPPEEHFPGACGGCHAEMGDEPTSLTPGALHVNGQVDVGGGGQGCGACHGRPPSDPWPQDAMHTLHGGTQLTLIQCGDCHSVPAQVVAEGHLDGTVQLAFSERAGAGGSYEPTTQTCSDTRCHAGVLMAPENPAPVWRGGQLGDGCERCHQTPPAPPHVQATACGGGLCHGAEVRGGAGDLGITDSGRSLHINGQVDHGGL